MGKSEDFSKVIKVVTELMDVTEEEILKARFYLAVDARWLVVRLMHDKGYKTRQIAPLVQSSTRTINHALAFFDDKADFSDNDLREKYNLATDLLAKVEQ
jgi:hypothetical protein